MCHMTAVFCSKLSLLWGLRYAEEFIVKRPAIGLC